MLKFLTKLKSASYVIAGLLVLSLSGLSYAANPVLGRVVESGVLRVGMSGEQPPFNFRTRSKSVIGFDVDLAEELARAMNVKLDIVEIPFGDLLAALLDGRVDMVMSGMSITPKRSRQVSFVGPYTLSGKSLLTTARVKDAAIEVSEFNDSNVRVVALKNSTSETFVRHNLPEASLHTIANYNEGIQQLLTGEIDAMVADIPILKLSMLRNPTAGLGIIEPPLAVEPIGIAIPNNDAQFANLVRNYLSALDKTGLTKQLRQKWFENDSWLAALP